LDLTDGVSPEEFFILDECVLKDLDEELEKVSGEPNQWSKEKPNGCGNVVAFIFLFYIAMEIIKSWN
jgi:hypothetical protein